MISSQDHIGRAAGVERSQSREFPVGHWDGASLIGELGEEGHGPRVSCVGASQGHANGVAGGGCVQYKGHLHC